MPLTPRKIGNAFVHPIGFGAMGIATFYGKTDPDEERFKVLDAALARGCNHWDTADVYADSEELIGRWFERTGKRDEVFIATKFGYASMDVIRGDPPFVKESVERSLKKLGIETIDLLYLHRPDPKTPIELTVQAMVEFVKAGKVRYLGLSECTATDIRRAHAVHPISAVQFEYSPFALELESPEFGLIQTARELDIALVMYSPLARGMITGRYKSPDDFEEGDMRRFLPKFSKDNFPKILSTVDKINQVGSRHNATPGQVTLAWILAQGDNVFVIPGTRKVKYLEENMGAADVELTKGEVSAIRKIAEEASLVGDRYMAGHMEMTLASTPPLPN